MNILVTGGTGLIGQRLVKILDDNGFQSRLLSRSTGKPRNPIRYIWDVEEEKIDPEAFEGVDVLIHLAGYNVAEGRWTVKRKKKILDSRIDSTRLLFKTIEQLDQRPKVLICASGTGYYGIQPFDHESSEDEDAGEDFLADVCVQWEAEANKFEFLGMRVVKVRTGVVLDQNGGAFEKIIQPIRYFVGAPLGSGKQYLSWIHWEDWCLAILHLIKQTDLSGAYNLVAPNPETNEDLTRLIARTMKRSLWLPNVPGFVLQLMLGQMSSLVLTGHKISSKKLEDSGYQFKYSNAQEAISELLGED